MELLTKEQMKEIQLKLIRGEAELVYGRMGDDGVHIYCTIRLKQKEG
jgi:hypothetical protein